MKHTSSLKIAHWLLALAIAATAPAQNMIQGAAGDGSTAYGAPVQIGGVDTNGAAQALLIGTDGTLPLPTGAATETTLAALSAQLPPALLNGGLAVTGTSGSVTGTAGALNANVELSVAGAAGAAIQVTGTWSGTLTFQSTINGTDWLTHNGTVYGGASVTNVSTATANGAWAFRVAGASKLRAIFTAWTSGTATINIRAATSVGGTASEGPATQPISGNVTATGVAGTAAAGATASGNPVQTGYVAATAIQTARTAGQMVIPASDKIGRTPGANEQIRDLTTMEPMVTLTSTTETTVAAAVASIFKDLRAVIITNTSATGTRVDFRTVAAGTVVFSVWAPPTTTISIPLPVVAKQATVNTAWTAQLGTAVTDVRVTAFTIQVN